MPRPSARTGGALGAAGRADGRGRVDLVRKGVGSVRPARDRRRGGFEIIGADRDLGWLRTLMRTLMRTLRLPTPCPYPALPPPTRPLPHPATTAPYPHRTRPPPTWPPPTWPLPTPAPSGTGPTGTGGPGAPAVEGGGHRPWRRQGRYPARRAPPLAFRAAPCFPHGRAARFPCRRGGGRVPPGNRQPARSYRWRTYRWRTYRWRAAPSPAGHRAPAPSPAARPPAGGPGPAIRLFTRRACHFPRDVRCQRGPCSPASERAFASACL